jgi:chromate transporter
MENEVVRRRRWLTPERFLDMLGAANLIPGPSSSELAIFIGYEQAGLRGLFVAGTCFILPASLLTALFAWAYVRFGALPRASGVLYGIKPVVIAIIVQALRGSSGRESGVAGRLVRSRGGRRARVDALVVLLASGAVSAAARRVAPWRRRRFDAWLIAWSHRRERRGRPRCPSALGRSSLAFPRSEPSCSAAAHSCSRSLRADLVDRLGWLTESQPSTRAVGR